MQARSIKEGKRFLGKVGYYHAKGSGRGGHEVWKHPEFKSLAIPRGKHLSPGVFREMLKKVGMTRDEYLGYRG